MKDNFINKGQIYEKRILGIIKFEELKIKANKSRLKTVVLDTFRAPCSSPRYVLWGLRRRRERVMG